MSMHLCKVKWHSRRALASVQRSDTMGHSAPLARYENWYLTALCVGAIMDAYHT